MINILPGASRGQTLSIQETSDPVLRTQEFGMEAKEGSKFSGVRKKNATSWQAYIYSGSKMVTLGTWASQEEAARERDKGAYKILGYEAHTHFKLSEDERADLDSMTVSEFLESNKVRSANRSFSKGASKYRGVSAFKGRWSAEIRVKGNLRHLGIFESEKEAADAYDAALIRRDGAKAVTNASFPLGFSEEALAERQVKKTQETREEGAAVGKEEAGVMGRQEGNHLTPYLRLENSHQMRCGTLCLPFARTCTLSVQKSECIGVCQ